MQTKELASANSSSRSALVLYGTETGTSQDFAEEIGRCLERLHFYTDVAGLEAVSYSQLSQYSCTVFVIATTGQGDFPENARRFWTSILRKKLSSTTLSSIGYAVVGLGDSSYPKFNWAARKLDKRFAQLGALSIIEPCEADEQGDEGTDGAFLAWLEQFQRTMLARFPLPEGKEPIGNDILLPSRWHLEQRSAKAEDPDTYQSSNGTGHRHPDGLSSSDTFAAILEINQRVTPSDHWQDVRFLSLKTSHAINYMPGDALAISPRNMPTDVSSLIERMNWHDVADTPIGIVSTRQSSHSFSMDLITSPIFAYTDLTLRSLLTEHLDINAIPRRSFFAAIANYTSDSMHKERLLEFTDPQYLDEYYDYATRPRRSILEILQEFDTVHLPWQEATNIFPALRPRQFSIASGGSLKRAADGSSTTFELLVAIVKYKTVIKRIREGVCTRYLAQLPVGTTLQVSLKTEGRFSKTADLAGQSHMLIGAGTGIAPLRALIHEKVAKSSLNPSKTALIFGCRSERSDFFFRDEWTALQSSSSPSNSTTQDEKPETPSQSPLDVITAFSRDQQAKVYVQDRIREHSALVWEFLRERHATVVVCGSSGQMPKAVRQALVDALVEQGQIRRDDTKGPLGEADDESGQEHIADHDAAEKYLARLEKEGRYKQETW